MPSGTQITSAQHDDRTAHTPGNGPSAGGVQVQLPGDLLLPSPAPRLSTGNLSRVLFCFIKAGLLFNRWRSLSDKVWLSLYYCGISVFKDTCLFLINRAAKPILIKGTKVLHIPSPIMVLKMC